MLKNTKTLQSGFSAPHLLPVVLVITIVGLAGANVYQAQQRKSEQARQAAAEVDRKKQEIAVKDAEKQQTVTIPATEEQKKTVEQPVTETKPKSTTTEAKPKQTVVYKNIETTSAQVGAENVVLTAKLPGTFAGYCKVMVKLPDGTNVQYFDAYFGPADTCSISVLKSKLTAGTEWKYFMQYKSADGLTRGEHGGNVFSL